MQRFPQPGERFGPYAIERKLSQGGQGVVLVARDAEGGRVALKLLLELEPNAVRRFEQEARLLETFTHPNVVGIRARGQVDGVPFLAMELVEGQPLDALVEATGIPDLDWTVETLCALAAALEYCHGHGVVHRDLKPGNVLFERGRPVLVDFGLAKRDPQALGFSTLDEAGRISLSQELKGTPSFMAPEQIDPSFGEVGPAADVYALGGLLFFLLTGEKPFSGAAPYNVLLRVMEQEAPDPRALIPQIPAPFAELCQASLAKSRDERPPSAAAFAERVEAALRPTRRRSGRAAVAGASVVLLTGAAGLLAALGDPGPPAARPTPPESGTGRAEEVEVLYAGLCKAYNAGRFLEALQRADELVMRYPHADAFRVRGSALHRLGFHELALDSYRRCLAIDPRSRDGQLGAGLALSSLKRWAEAETLLTVLLERRPENVTGLRLRANARLRQGDVAGGLRDWREVVRLDPKSPRAHYGLVGALRATGRFAATVAAAKRLLELDPRHARGYYQLGMAYGSMKPRRDDLALSALNRSISLAPRESSLAYNARGNVRMRLGDEAAARGDVRAARSHYTGAARDLEEALRQLLPPHRSSAPRIRATLARVRAKLGR